jgi:predicted ATP-grasp superfamily ATP-dependent carboligase
MRVMDRTKLAPQPLALLRSNDICFLGIARSCAAAGLPVLPITFDWAGAGPWYSELSCCVPAGHGIPNPYQQPAEAAKALVQIITEINQQRRASPLLLGSSDTNLMFMLDNQESLAGLTRNMGSADFEAIRGDVIRKDSCAELLRAGSVPIPITYVCTAPSQIAQIVDAVTYPCIYKPLEKDYGQTFYARHGGSKAIEIA